MCQAHGRDAVLLVEIEANEGASRSLGGSYENGRRSHPDTLLAAAEQGPPAAETRLGQPPKQFNQFSGSLLKILAWKTRFHECRRKRTVTSDDANNREQRARGRGRLPKELGGSGSLGGNLFQAAFLIRSSSSANRTTKDGYRVFQETNTECPQAPYPSATSNISATRDGS